MSTKLVIVGGVAGGASAAARARRLDENAQIIMFERGEFVSFANCGLPYYIGKEIKEKEKLIVVTPELFKDRFNIDVRRFSEVIDIDTEKKQIKIKDLKTGDIYFESYDKLVLSPGARPLKPPIPGIDMAGIFTLRNIPDMDRIKKHVEVNKPKKAVVVGGGFIGLEMAENLVNNGIDVTVVEMLDQVMAPVDYEMASVVHIHLADQGVHLHLSDGVKNFRKQDDQIVVTTQNGAEFEADIVILSIGVRPETELAKKAGLELGELGGIKTDETMRTSNPDIYAVGDAVEVVDFVTGRPTLVPLAGPANKQGRIAADNVMGRRSVYKGTQGTAIVKVFELTVASTGINEKTARKLRIPYMVSYTHSGSHASYYPMSQMMNLKIIFRPDDGRILGAQIVGQKGTDKRIDVLATAVRAGMTVNDLEELELAYAPPYSSAKDPVNMAGYVASNILKGDVEVLYWDDIDCLDMDTHVFLDVRDKAEVKLMGGIPGFINIPINELRIRMQELDKGKDIIAYCSSGLRSYIAARMLMQNGFHVKNLSGGWKTYHAPKKTLGDKAAKVCALKQLETNGKGEIIADYDLDACGLQCPGPVLKLKEKIDSMKEGQVLRISASDSGFPSDARAWCAATGNELVSRESKDGIYSAVIRKGGVNLSETRESTGGQKELTLIVFSDDLDRALASFIIANGAASIGTKVTIFFTFWGLNILKKQESPAEKKDLLASMFGAMMPKGPDRLTLSKMHFAGLGTEMMKFVMKNKNVESLDVLMQRAIDQGVRLVACTMTMEIMGIKRSELIDGIHEGGVASYLESAGRANVNLFI